LDKQNSNYSGCLEFIVVIKAKIKNSILFKIYSNMEGVFIGNKEKIDFEAFQKMLEINGLTTLSQLSRAYIISATALSGINPPVKMPMINVLSLIKRKKEKGEKAKES
jgi:preprotein translocase subunit SecB